MRKVACVLALFSIVALGMKDNPPPTPYAFPSLRFFPTMPRAAENPVTNEGAILGRHLFYDPILSVDNTLSCSSCHKQQAAFSDAPNRFSSGRDGNPLKRNTQPLFNLAWYPALFWDGRASTLEEQIFHPVRSTNEMNLPWKKAAVRLKKNSFYSSLFTKAFGNTEIDSVQIAKAIAQFLRTLISYQSKYDRVLQGEAVFSKDEYEGLALANDQTKGDCLHCHSTDGDALGTLLVFSNNGLDAADDPGDYKDKGRGLVTGKQSDNGKFMVPSLRNLAFTAPYMHDGRFQTLEEVLDFYSTNVRTGANTDSKMQYAHRGGVALTADEKKKVLAFLLTLTDSTFVSNPDYAKPLHGH